MRIKSFELPRADCSLGRTTPQQSAATEFSKEQDNWMDLAGIAMWEKFQNRSKKLKLNSLINGTLAKLFSARDGKSIQNSTDEYFSPKNSTKMRISQHISICAKKA